MGNWAKESALCDIGERIGARWTDADTSQDLRFNRREHKNYLKEAVFMILLAIKDRRAGGWRLAMQKMSFPLVVKRLYSRPVRLDKGKMNPPGRPLCYNKPSPPRMPLVPFSLTKGLSWNP